MDGRSFREGAGPERHFTRATLIARIEDEQHRCLGVLDFLLQVGDQFDLDLILGAEPLIPRGSAGLAKWPDACLGSRDALGEGAERLCPQFLDDAIAPLRKVFSLLWQVEMPGR